MNFYTTDGTCNYRGYGDDGKTIIVWSNRHSKRRSDAVKAKRRAKALMKNVWHMGDEWVTDQQIGKMANTHCKPCSCPACGNPRKHFNKPTRQELINYETLDSENDYSIDDVSTSRSIRG